MGGDAQRAVCIDPAFAVERHAVRAIDVGPSLRAVVAADAVEDALGAALGAGRGLDRGLGRLLLSAAARQGEQDGDGEPDAHRTSCLPLRLLRQLPRIECGFTHFVEGGRALARIPGGQASSDHERCSAMPLSASLPRKIAASVALLAAVAGIAAAGTSAALRHSTSRLSSAGTVDLQLNGSDTNQTIGQMTTAAPGDSITRTVSVENNGTLAFADVLLTTEGSSSNALTAATSGLQMVVDRCSVAWTGTDAAATCDGTITPVIASTDVVGSNRSLSLALDPSATAYLRIKLTLPSGYPDNTGVSNATRFTFDALQRTATA